MSVGVYLLHFFFLQSLQRSRIELVRLYVFCDDNIKNLNFTSTQPGFNKSSRKILQNFREASHTEKPEIHSIHICSFWNYWMTRELVYLYQTWTVVHTGTCIHMVWLSLQLGLEKKIKHSTSLHCYEGEWHKDCVSLVGGAVVALGWTSFKKQSPWSSQSHSASLVGHTEHSKPYLDIMGLTQDPNFKKLQDWYTAHALNINLRHMFEADKERFNKLRYFLPKFLTKST